MSTLIAGVDDSLADVATEDGVRCRKRPVVVDAIFFDGTNADAVEKFCGGPEWFHLIDEEDRDDQEVIAEVFDRLHSTWVGVMARQWIIRGVKGELYPCAEDVFAETYEVA